MIVIKAFNVVHQGRKNQNTSYWFSEKQFGYSKDTPDDVIVSELNIHKPKDVQLQKNSFCKIVNRY